jgi:outer membrane protein
LKTTLFTLPKRLAWLALCVCSLAQAQAQAPLQGSRVAYVQTERLMTESKLSKIADAKIEAEFSKRRNAISEQVAKLKEIGAKLEKDAPTISEFERNKRTRELHDMDNDLERKNREYREDLNQRLNEERAAIATKAHKLIEQIAQEEKIDIVLQEWVWASPRLDITDKILKRLDQ